MSQENAEIVRRSIEAANEHGFSSEAVREFYDEAVVFEEPPEQPAPRTAVGRDAAAELFGQFEEAWEEHRTEPVESRTLDAERVLMFTIEHFRGRDGLVIDQPCAAIFTLRNRKIVRLQAFWERTTALEAAGL